MMGLGRGSVASTGKKNIIFTVGDQINAEQTQALYTTANSSIRGVAHWYNDRGMIDGGGGLGSGWGSGWINSSDTTFQNHYALGECIEAIVWLADVDAYATQPQFYNTDLPYVLSNIYLGHGPNYGECYVVLFSEFNATYDDGQPRYGERLRMSYLNAISSIRAMSLPSGAVIRVGLGFGGYAWPGTPDLSFWEPAIAASDFTCAQHMQDGGNYVTGAVDIDLQIRDCVAQLGSYGKPVMISHFELWGQDANSDPAWTKFVTDCLNNDAWMAARKRDGLFFWNFMAEPNVNNTANEPTWTNAATAMRKHRARHTSFSHWQKIPPATATTAPSIDASSPAAVRNTATTRTTASFTPPSGSLIVAFVGNNSAAGVQRTHTVTDSAGGLWVQRVIIGDNSGTDAPGVRSQSEVWVRHTPGAGGGTTATTTPVLPGGGFQNAFAVAPTGVGHSLKAASGADVAGVHVSVDGVSWTPSNEGLPETGMRVAGLAFSQTVADRLYAYVSSATGAPVGGIGGRLMRGTYSPAGGTATWVEVASFTNGAAAGGNTMPRQTGRMLALDETNNVAFVGSIDGIHLISNISGTGTVTAARALTGAEVTGIVLNPADTNIGYATVDSPAGSAGIWRIANIRSGTVASTRNSTFTNPQDLVVVDEGAQRVVYAACMAQGVRSWVAAADITTGWTDRTGTLTLGSDGVSAIDARGSGATTKLLVSMAGTPITLNAGGWSNNQGGTWSNESGGWTVTDTIRGLEQPWWLTQNSPFYALNGNGWDSMAVRFDPADTTKAFMAGRSGIWSTLDGGGSWRPAIQGLSATVSWGVQAAPTGTRAIVYDGDWGPIDLPNKAASAARRIEPGANPGTGMGVMFRTDTGRVALALGDWSASTNGEVYAGDSPYTSWTDLGFSAVPSDTNCCGVAIGLQGANEIILTVHDGTGIQRKVGAAAPTTVSTGVTNGFYSLAKFWWPNSHTGTQGTVFLSAANGLWRSPDYGATWTQIHTYTNTSEYTGRIVGLPADPVNTLFLTVKGSISAGLYKVTNAAGSSTLTLIEGATDPGPCTVNSSGEVYFAVTANEPGGVKLYKSASANPGAATTFTDVSNAQWRGGVVFPSDLSCYADGDVLASNKQGGYFVFSQGSGGASITVTDTLDVAEGAVLKVLALTSVNQANPIGDVATASGTGTAAGVTLTTIYPNSSVIGFVTEWNTLAVGTAGTGCTVSDGATSPSITSYILRRTSATTSPGSAALTTTAPTTGTEWNIAAAEFRGIGTTSTTDLFAATGTDTSPSLNYNQFGAPPSNSTSSSGCTNSIVTAEGTGYLHDMGGASASTPNGTSPAVASGSFTFWNDMPSGSGVYNWQHIRWRCRPDLDTQSVAGYYWAHQGKLTATSGGAGNDWYAGLQSRSSLSGNPKAINFAIWGGVTGVAGDIASTVSQAFSGEGSGWQVMAPFTWTAGRTYSFRFAVDASRGSRWFSLHVKDETTSAVTYIGSIQAGTTDAWYVRGVSYNFSELFSQVTPATTCPLLPRATAWFSPPIFSQG